MKNSKIIQILKSVNKITVTSHVRPDGDAVGSSMALAEALSQMGKDVQVVFVDEVPSKYLFLEGADNIIMPSQAIKTTDLLIMLDGDLSRVGGQNFLTVLPR